MIVPSAKVVMRMSFLDFLVIPAWIVLDYGVYLFASALIGRRRQPPARNVRRSAEFGRAPTAIYCSRPGAAAPGSMLSVTTRSVPSSPE